jgi:hypothetical protein
VSHLTFRRDCHWLYTRTVQGRPICSHSEVGYTKETNVSPSYAERTKKRILEKNWTGEII